MFVCLSVYAHYIYINNEILVTVLYVYTVTNISLFNLYSHLYMCVIIYVSMNLLISIRIYASIFVYNVFLVCLCVYGGSRKFDKAYISNSFHQWCVYIGFQVCVYFCGPSAE